MNQLNAKTCYLVLYDEGRTFKRLQQELFLDSTERLHSSLRMLANRRLIYSHPLLLVKRSKGVSFSKLHSINLEIMDRSHPALLWAVSSDPDIERGMPPQYYKDRLRAIAEENRDSIMKWDRFRGLAVDFLLIA